MLDVTGLCVCYGSHTVLNNVSFFVREGQWLMLVGPNGAGKSTLISAVSQSVPYGGSVLVRGKDASAYPPRAMAKELGVLQQNHAVGYAFTVSEIVRLGRYAFSASPFAPRAEGDDEAVERALHRTGLTRLRHASVLQLSGGELQRTFLAQLYAQNPPLLLLDEPASHLDPAFQREVFSGLSEWLCTPGRAIVSVVHDLSLAARYGTHALLLNAGETVAFGTIENVLTKANLHRAYGMDVFAWRRELLAHWNEREGAYDGFCGD